MLGTVAAIASEAIKRSPAGTVPQFLTERLRVGPKRNCLCNRSNEADSSAFGRFADELRRLLLWKRRPHQAARARKFSPERLVGWLLDELQRWEPLTLHDFRRTAITALQMGGASEKEVSIQVGATPEVIRRHYQKLNQQTIARRNMEKRAGSFRMSMRPVAHNTFPPP